jgi:hypothetical protein
MPDEIDWKSLGDFDLIELIVTRPVQSEIDQHKNQGSTRLSGRARATSTVFREILLSPEKRKIVRAEKPTVRLVIRQDLLPARLSANSSTIRRAMMAG